MNTLVIDVTHPSIKDGKINVAVVTGNHVFDVPEFVELFRSMSSIDFYMQDLENYAADMSDVRRHYDDHAARPVSSRTMAAGHI